MEHEPRWRRRCALLAVSFALVGVAPAGASSDEILLIGLQPGTTAEARAALHALAGATVLDRIPSLDVDRVAVPVGTVRGLYRAHPAVSFVEPDGIGTLAIPRANDLLRDAPEAWRLARANFPLAWERWPGRYYTAANKPRNAVRVAVLDGWIATDHPDFVNRKGTSPASRRGGQINFARAIDIVDPANQRGAMDWHGTFIAGLIGAAAHNGIGIHGASYAAQLVPVIIADGEGNVGAFDAAKGITHAVENGVRVLNASFAIPGNAGGLSTLERAIKRAGRADAVVIAAAGNTGTRIRMYPAGFARQHRNVIAVSASGALDTIAHCSSYGPHVTVAAPGTDIVSLDPGGGTRSASCGTSAAAALVSSAAAAIAGRTPDVGADAIRRRIRRAADDIMDPGPDVFTGAGRLNAQRALGIPGPTTVAERPRAAGQGESTVVFARASGRRIIAAEYFIGLEVAPGKGNRMRAVDGRFGGRTERVRAKIATAELSEGIHELYVRARGGRGRWGATSVVPLVVDRTPPAVSDVRAEPTVIVPGDTQARLHLTIGDALSRTMAVRISFIDATGTVQAAHRYRLPSGIYVAPWRGTVDPPGGTSFDGDALPPGPYTVRVRAKDEAGHVSIDEGSFVIAPDPR